MGWISMYELSSLGRCLSRRYNSPHGHSNGGASGGWRGGAKKLFPEKTERLKLLLRTRLHSDAEGAGSAELAEILAARVPEGWPPKFVAPPTSEAGSWSNCDRSTPVPEKSRS